MNADDVERMREEVERLVFSPAAANEHRNNRTSLMSDKNDTSSVVITVDRHARTGSLQISISDEFTGYRIAGQKYDGHSECLRRVILTQRDADNIRWYLDAAFPQDK